MAKKIDEKHILLWTSIFLCMGIVLTLHEVPEQTMSAENVIVPTCCDLKEPELERAELIIEPIEYFGDVPDA